MPVGYAQNNSNNIDYRSNDEKDDSVGLGGRGGGGGGGREGKEGSRTELASAHNIIHVCIIKKIFIIFLAVFSTALESAEEKVGNTFPVSSTFFCCVFVCVVFAYPTDQFKVGMEWEDLYWSRHCLRQCGPQSSDHARHFINRCDIYKVAIVVQRNRSDNHCKRVR